METNDILVIVVWTCIACFLIAAGIAKSREQATQRSRIFQRGNEWYSQAYSDAVTGIEEEMDVWIKK